MLKQILRKAVTPIRVTVVVIALGALIASGVFSAERACGVYMSADKQAETLPESAQLLAGPPSPDEIPQSMTPSGKPDSEAYAYFSAAPLIDFSKADSRLAVGGDKADIACRTSAQTGGKSRVRASASEISSRLGVQFTLVGAKPSGTS